MEQIASGRLTSSVGLQGSPGSSGASCSRNTQITLGAWRLYRVAARGQQLLGSGLPPASRSRRVGLGGSPEPCPAGAWLLAGWRDHAELWPGLQWPFLLLLPAAHGHWSSACPNHGVSCPETQALCLGCLHPIPYPNPGAASQALPSPAPGCWFHPGLLPSSTSIATLPSCCSISKEVDEGVGCEKGRRGGNLE